MLGNLSVPHFAKKDFWGAGWLVVCILALLAYALPQLTTRPQVFYDEGYVIEEAHNLLDYGKADIFVAPGEFSGLGHIANSNWYPTTLPLAGFFGIFGFGIVQARVYALLWMILFLIVQYVFTRKFFGLWPTVASTALLITLPPFFSNGRMVMGDIPGMTLMLCGLLLFEGYRRYFWAGILIGLSLVSRPSVYMWQLPALVLAMAAVDRKDPKQLYSRLERIAPGVMIPVAIWFLFTIPESFSLGWWQATYSFFKNPSFGGSYSLVSSLATNAVTFFSALASVHLLVLLATISSAWYLRRREFCPRFLSYFILVYGTFIVLYFLRSPGWFKYLLPLQLLSMTFFPLAVFVVFRKIGEKFGARDSLPKVATAFVSASLVVAQAIFLHKYADIFASSDVQDAAAYVEASVPVDGSAGFVHAPQVAALVRRDEYQLVVVNGQLSLGRDFLTLSPGKLPQTIVIPEGIFDVSATEVDANYVFDRQIGRFAIYRLVPVN